MRCSALLFVAACLLPADVGAATAERPPIDLSLVVEPGGLARAVAAGATAESLVEAAAGAGFGRILISTAPLRQGDRPTGSKPSPEAVAQAARARGLKVWAVLPLFGPMPGLETRHLAAPRDGGDPLAGVPCYALPEARAALRRAAEHSLRLPVDGLLLLADVPVTWPEGNAAAREFGYNAPVVEEFRKRYGSDPRRAAPAGREALFFVRLKGEHLAAAARDVAGLARGQSRKVGLALPLSETSVPTTRHAFIDAEELIREGVVDELALLEERRLNLHRWKVQAYPSPHAALWLEVGTEGKGLRAAVTAALDNVTADGLILDALPALASGRWGEVTAAVEAWREQRAEEEGFAAALASGELRIATGVEEKRANDQATAHGVAQSFTLEQPARAAAVRLLAALRLRGTEEAPDLPVEVRADRDGKPEGAVLAQGVIHARTLSPDPGYRWATARFTEAVTLEAGKRYWISLPDLPAYVWRLDKSASYPGGRAWSSKYDYTKSDWIFQVIAGGNP